MKPFVNSRKDLAYSTFTPIVFARRHFTSENSPAI